LPTRERRVRYTPIPESRAGKWRPAAAARR